MIKTTRWSPDTCGCVLEYQWDDTTNENNRTHTISKAVSACEAHKHLTNKVQHYNSVLEENRRKNVVYGEIIDKIPSAVEEIVPTLSYYVVRNVQENLPIDNMTKQLKPGKQFKWSFDKDRNLEIDLVGFDASEKAEVKTITDKLFPNKVKVK